MHLSWVKQLKKVTASSPDISNFFKLKSLGIFNLGGGGGVVQDAACGINFWQEDHSVEYNETLSWEQASPGAVAALGPAGLEEFIAWDEKSNQSQDFIPAWETPGVTAFPKKELIS